MRSRTPICLQCEARFKELTSLGLKVQVVAVGKKAQTYFKRRPKFNVVSKCGSATEL